VRVLVLGGTAFLGRHLVAAAVARGHEVTLFTRGRTNPGLFPELEHVQGDRETDLGMLAGRSFDAAIDTSGYLPRVVSASAGRLAGAVDRYVFFSTIAVYDEARVLRETCATQPAPDPPSEDVSAHYGALKALCEQAVEAELPGRTILVRPGLVTGSHDYTGRFGYWPHRVARGGEVLAPGRPGTRVWLVDARDVAEWTVRLLETGATGIFNVAGPGAPLSFGALLDTCARVTGGDARFEWVDDAFLLEHGVVPYTELPLWFPESEGGYPEIDTARAVAAGLTFRPLEATIRDALEDSGYDAGTAGAFGLPRRPAGLAPGRERELLADWRARRAG
jgi:2'-hydroxyisoflavone reductase